MFLFSFFFGHIWTTHFEPVSQHMFWKFNFSWQWEVNLASLETASFWPSSQQDFCSESSAAGMSLSFGSPCQSLAGPSDQIILWRGTDALLACAKSNHPCPFTHSHSAVPESWGWHCHHEGATSVPAILSGHSQEASQHVLGYTLTFPPPPGPLPHTHLNRFAACLCLVTYIKLCLGQLLP